MAIYLKRVREIKSQTCYGCYFLKNDSCYRPEFIKRKEAKLRKGCASDNFIYIQIEKPEEK